MNINIQVNVGGHKAVSEAAQKAGLFCADINRSILDFKVVEDFFGLELKIQKKLAVNLLDNEIVGEPRLGYVLRVINNGIDIVFPNDTFATVNFSGPMVLELTEEKEIVQKDDINQDTTETFIKMKLSSKPGNALGMVHSIEFDEYKTIEPKIKECREIEVYLTIPNSKHSVQAAYGGIKTNDRKYFAFNESV